MAKKTKPKPVAAPMCGSSRVYFDGIPLTAISLQDNPKEFQNLIGIFRPGFPQSSLALLNLPLTTRSWEVIQKACFGDEAYRVLGFDVVAQYNHETALQYSCCYVTNVAFSASPGDRMEMKILFAYLGKSEIKDFKPATVDSPPQRVLTWNDFGGFVERALSPWRTT